MKAFNLYLKYLQVVLNEENICLLSERGWLKAVLSESFGGWEESFLRNILITQIYHIKQRLFI